MYYCVGIFVHSGINVKRTTAVIILCTVTSPVKYFPRSGQCIKSGHITRSPLLSPLSNLFIIILNLQKMETSVLWTVDTFHEVHDYSQPQPSVIMVCLCWWTYWTCWLPYFYCLSLSVLVKQTNSKLRITGKVCSYLEVWQVYESIEVL